MNLPSNWSKEPKRAGLTTPPQMGKYVLYSTDKGGKYLVLNIVTRYPTRVVSVNCPVHVLQPLSKVGRFISFLPFYDTGAGDAYQNLEKCL